MGVVERAHRVRDGVNDAQPTGVERLRGDVLRVHHPLAALEILTVPGGLAQVLGGQLDGPDRVAQRRLEVQPGDIGLGGVRQDVEPTLRGVVNRAVEVQDRVVD